MYRQVLQEVYKLVYKLGAWWCEVIYSTCNSSTYTLHVLLKS